MDLSKEQLERLVIVLLNKNNELENRLKETVLESKEQTDKLNLSAVSCSKITDSDLGKEFVVIKESDGHEFKKGSVVRLNGISSDGYYILKDKTGDWWVLKADEVRRKEE